MSGSPRVLISADLEGISGVVHPTETNPGGYDYERSRELMTAEVNAAVTRRGEVPPLVVPGPVRLEVDLYGPYTVDLAMLVPGVERAAGGRTVAFGAADLPEAYRLVQLLVQLAQIKPG